MNGYILRKFGRLGGLVNFRLWTGSELVYIGWKRYVGVIFREVGEI